MEENTQSDQTQDEAAGVLKESFLRHLFPGFAKFILSLKVSSILIPSAIILLVLLAGSGGTYIIASNIFSNQAKKNVGSQISENDIPNFLAILTPTSIPITPSPTLGLDVIPPDAIEPTTALPSAIDPSSNWISYTFEVLGLNFKYPPGWYVNVSSGSGPPALTVQNFSPNSPVYLNTDGVYAIKISRFPQVGITAVSNLTSQLAINEANTVYINGLNMGLVTVINSGSRTINGYQAYERTITYSNSPFSQVYQLFILDGSGNVVQFTPAFDVTYGQSYFNTFISTISF